MTDREKVIKGLECCVAYDYKCNDCPYQDDGGAEDGCYSDELKAAALALLKAQEPRVMTVTEAYTADCVYIEFDGAITPAIRTTNERDGHRKSYFATQQLGGDWMRWDDYGITWRCWTSRPDEKRRAETPWS